MFLIVSHSILYLAQYQIKAKFMLVGTKEIKKVAEARMRKKKRAANTLKAAKKSATMMAENSEMSEKQKLKVFNYLHLIIKYNMDILSNE